MNHRVVNRPSRLTTGELLIENTFIVRHPTHIADYGGAFDRVDLYCIRSSTQWCIIDWLRGFDEVECACPQLCPQHTSAKCHTQLLMNIRVCITLRLVKNRDLKD